MDSGHVDWAILGNRKSPDIHNRFRSHAAFQMPMHFLLLNHLNVALVIYEDLKRFINFWFNKQIVFFKYN